MANRARGELTLVAGDRAYTLRLTTNACCELEDRSGLLLDEVMRQAYRGSVRGARWLLWAALQDGYADTVKTPNDAGRIIDEAGGIRGVIAQLIAFVQLNANEDEGGPGGSTADPPSAQVGTAGAGSISAPVPSA